MPILLLELTITRCSDLQIISRLFRARLNVLEISNFSEPAKISYRGAFNSLKHKQIYPQFH